MKYPYKDESFEWNVFLKFSFIFLAFLGGLFFIAYRMGEDDAQTYVMAFVAFCSFLIIVGVASYLMAKSARKKYKNIMDNGVRYDGKVIDYRKKVYGSNKQADYWAVVEYYDCQEKCTKKVETGYLAFDPRTRLAQRTCTVYVYGEKVYVNDFVLTRKGEDSVFFIEEGEAHFEVYWRNLDKRAKRKIIGACVAFLVIMIVLANLIGEIGSKLFG